MDAATLQPMAGKFIEATGLNVDMQPDARRFAGYQLNQTAELLPEPEAWAVVGQEEGARLLLLTGDALLTLSREASPGQDPQLVVTCHPAQLNEVSYRRDGQRTFWHFRFCHPDDPLAVEGQIDYRSTPGQVETFDQAEVFARALACKIDWRIGDIRGANGKANGL